MLRPAKLSLYGAVVLHVVLYTYEMLVLAKGAGDMEKRYIKTNVWGIRENYVWRRRINKIIIVRLKWLDSNL